MIRVVTYYVAQAVGVSRVCAIYIADLLAIVGRRSGGGGRGKVLVIFPHTHILIHRRGSKLDEGGMSEEHRSGRGESETTYATGGGTARDVNFHKKKVE